MINTAPPFCPAIYGKRHIFPKPTADPAVARITPSLLPKLALSSLAIFILLINSDAKVLKITSVFADYADYFVFLQQN
jgi:hypothetical protein